MVSTNWEELICEPSCEETLKSAQKINEANTSIADEASEWLAAQELVPA